MSERDDERISEPPALEGEVMRWRQPASWGAYWCAVDGKGNAFCYVPNRTADPHGPGWWRPAEANEQTYHVAGEATRRLAAELAAYRARDEGDTGIDSEALQRLYDYWCGRIQRRDELRPTRMEPGEERMYDEYMLSKGALVQLLDAARALLTRRATATTVTPAGEETSGDSPA